MKESAAVRPQIAKETVPIKLSKGTDITERFNETFGKIAQRAFELFEATGYAVGHDLEHWFKAEAELLHPLHIEITEKGDELFVRAEVPGFATKDIDIQLEPTRLTITAKRQTREERQEGGKTIFSEYCADQIFRMMDLPMAVDPAKAEAALKEGILELRLPMATEAKKVKIEPRST